MADDPSMVRRLNSYAISLEANDPMAVYLTILSQKNYAIASADHARVADLTIALENALVHLFTSLYSRRFNTLGEFERRILKNAKNAIARPEGLTPADRFNRDLTEFALDLSPENYCRSYWQALELRTVTGLKPLPLSAERLRFIASRTLPPLPPLRPGCSLCFRPAYMRCSACQDTPTKPDTLYCDVKCQSTHYPTHINKCKALQKLRTLHRGVDLISELFKIWNDNCYMLDILSVGELNGILYVMVGDHRLYVEGWALPVLGIPNNVRPEFKDVLGAVHKNPCYFYAIMDDIIKALLPVHYAIVREVTVKVKAAPRPTTIMTSIARSYNNMYDDHIVLQVSLATREKLCVDFTGVKYGFKETVKDWDDFCRDHVLETRSDKSQGTARTVYELQQSVETTAHYNISRLFYRVFQDFFIHQKMPPLQVMELPFKAFEAKKAELIATMATNFPGLLKAYRQVRPIGVQSDKFEEHGDMTDVLVLGHLFNSDGSITPNC